MGIEDEALKAATEAVGKLAGEVYADLAHPAARQIGTALETIFKVGLSPVAMLDWGFEKSKHWLKNKIARRLEETPTDCRITPPNNIAIPAIMNIAMSSDAPDLRELYAELLMKAMDSRTADMVHPSYITLLAQLSPEEALVFVSFREKGDSVLFSDTPTKWFLDSQRSIERQFTEYCYKSLGIENVKPSGVWLDNLKRLGLIALDHSSEAIYRAPDEDRPEPRVDTQEDRYVQVTEYGRAFLEACAPVKKGFDPPATTA